MGLGAFATRPALSVEEQGTCLVWPSPLVMVTVCRQAITGVEAPVPCLQQPCHKEAVPALTGTCPASSTAHEFSSYVVYT